jgi:iron-sulfur cluster repair protein YtfE (RIC family)
VSKPKDAIALLTKGHAEVHKLFLEEEKVEKRSASGKVDLFNQIKAALVVHTTIEEEIFYPAVKKARSEHIKDEVREATEEHKQIKSMLAQISEITPDDESYDMKVKVLKEDVEHHVKEEEGEMFPDARKYLGEKRLDALGEEMVARKLELEENDRSDSTPGSLGKADRSSTETNQRKVG